VHLLLILVLLCLVFPAFGRLLGSMVSAIFWIVLILMMAAMFGAFSN
jgi:hypothetical protein